LFFYLFLARISGLGAAFLEAGEPVC
jgi:hypothetical protein